MSIQRVCDRCGRSEDFHMTGSWRKVNVFPGSSDLEDALEGTENETPQFNTGRDLCAQCVSDFERRFMKNITTEHREPTDNRFR